MTLTALVVKFVSLALSVFGGIVLGALYDVDGARGLGIIIILAGVIVNLC